MKKLTKILGLFLLLAVPAFSDTLVLKSGEKITGYFDGGSARVIQFRGSDGVVKGYDVLSVQQLQFGDAKSAVSAPPDPRLMPAAERVTRPTSSNAANTGRIVPTASKIVIRMIDTVNSEQNKVGETFVAVLE